MMITEENRGTVVIAKLSGRLDAAVTRDVRDRLIGMAGQSEKGIVLDMQQVDFIDSSGLGLLVSLVKATAEIDRALGLCSLTPQAQSLFELTRMSKIFPIYTDGDAASAAMG
jgi:anti-sigma B factor antagonist